MSEIADIKIKRRKGQPSEEVLQANLEAGWGLQGDVFAGKGDRQLSIFESEARLDNSDKKDGFCIRNFSNNISTRDLKINTLTTQSKLRIGEAMIQITQVGKECYPECPVFQREGFCGLSNKAAYGKVIYSGKIEVGDCITIL